MPSSVRKRTYNLDGDLIGEARRLLDTRTDTEAIHRALRKTVEDARIERSLNALLRRGRFLATYS